MSVISPGRNLVLIGLMGAGKSTVGRLLAARLRRPFADTDAIVEEETGLTVPEIFAQKGERGFRALEAEVVRRVSALRGQVVAVGGGAVSTPGNATQLRMTGDLVLLDAEPAALAARVGQEATARPLLVDADDIAARLAELRRRRQDDYVTAAAYTVATDAKSVDDTVADILDWACHRQGLLTWEERETLG